MAAAAHQHSPRSASVRLVHPVADDPRVDVEERFADRLGEGEVAPEVARSGLS